MVISSTTKIITPEDVQKLQEAYKEYKDTPLNQIKEARKVWEQIQQRYVAEHTPEEIKADVAESLEALTVEDFKERLEEAKKDLKDTKLTDITYYMKEYETRENYINASDFVYEVVSFYYTSVADHSDNKKLLEDIEQAIRIKALEWYGEPTKEEIAEYIKIYSFKADLMPQPLKKIVYPLDKVNKRIFEQKEITNNTSLAIKTGKSEDSGVMVSFMIPEYMTSCKLDNFDKLVYIVVASLYYAGNKQITTNMIFKAMGNTGRPSKDQMNKINNSLSRLSLTRIVLTNEDEIKEKHNKYKLYEIKDEALLNFQRKSFLLKGRNVAVINLLNAPVLLRFAKDRGQITTFNAALLEDNLNNTDLNVHIKSYLLDYISHAKKNKKLQRKLLFETLCGEFQVGSTRAQRSRLKSKINNLMQFYQKNGFIKSFYFDKASNLYFNL